MVTTSVCPRSRASSIRYGRTTRTAMAQTRTGRCTPLTCTRTHSCSRGKLPRRHQLQVQAQQRLPPRLQRRPRLRLLPLHQRQLRHQHRELLLLHGPIRHRRPVRNGKRRRLNQEPRNAGNSIVGRLCQTPRLSQNLTTRQFGHASQSNQWRVPDVSVNPESFRGQCPSMSQSCDLTPFSKLLSHFSLVDNHSLSSTLGCLLAKLSELDVERWAFASRSNFLLLSSYSVQLSRVRRGTNPL
jgi:hypothetical protein